MVSYLEDYEELLQRGVVLFDKLLALYTLDRQAEKDWADVTIAETTIKRNGMLERLTNPKLSAAHTSTLVGSIRTYLDKHWADYQEFPVANLEKRMNVEALHAELEAIMDAAGDINNALRNA